MHLDPLDHQPTSLAVPLGFRVHLAPIKPWAVVVWQHSLRRYLISVGIEVGLPDEVRDIVDLKIRIVLAADHLVLDIVQPVELAVDERRERVHLPAPLLIVIQDPNGVLFQWTLHHLSVIGLTISRES